MKLLLLLILSAVGADMQASPPLPHEKPPDRKTSEGNFGSLFGGKKRAVVTSTSPRFIWPDSLTSETLKGAVIDYATLVGTCMTKDRSKMDKAQKKWSDERKVACNALPLKAGQLKAKKDPGFTLENKKKEFCKEVRIQLVDKHYSEGECSQYGNCGEAAYVNYCLAFLAGLPAKICSSANDHVFALTKLPNQEVCVMDRWNLRGTHTPEDFFFCGPKVGVNQEGTVMVPQTETPGETAPSHRKWYQVVHCYDPLHSRAQISVTAENWDEAQSWTTERARSENEEIQKRIGSTSNDQETIDALNEEVAPDEKAFQEERKKRQSTPKPSN